MTVYSGNKNKEIPAINRLPLAKSEWMMGQDIAADIYNSRQSEPNENLLIRNFYYSIYHLVKCISIIESGRDYSSHSSLISFFCRQNKQNDFLGSYGIHLSANTNYYLNRLFVLRDQYDYKDRFVDEEDYLEAEMIWKELYPDLDNTCSTIMSHYEKQPEELPQK